jgi:NTP pyrophosphatase (non-canonical NTP hydrolase)
MIELGGWWSDRLTDANGVIWKALLGIKVEQPTSEVFTPTMYDTISEYQSLHNDGVRLQDTDYHPKEIQEAIFFIMEELHEAAQELPDNRKPWKDALEGWSDWFETNEQAFMEEMIDVMFMIYRLFLMMGWTPEQVNQAFENKLNKNMKRPDHRFVARELGGNTLKQ